MNRYVRSCFLDNRLNPHVSGCLCPVHQFAATNAAIEDANAVGRAEYHALAKWLGDQQVLSDLYWSGCINVYHFEQEKDILTEISELCAESVSRESLACEPVSVHVALFDHLQS